MDVRPIRNDDDLAWALAEVEPYFINEPAPGTPEGDRFDVLVQLIEAYEARHFPIEPLDPVSFLRAHMENTGRTQADLARVLGSASRASEIINRKRSLLRAVQDKGLPSPHVVDKALAQPALAQVLSRHG